MNILTKTPTPITVTPHVTFNTFASAWAYTMLTCQGIQKAGWPVVAAKVWQDRFKQFRPRDLQSKILGFGRKAVNDCERLAPGGRWTVLAESVDGGFQFSLAYSKYLPYAHAMLLAEDGYKAFGLDFEGINSFFGTCMGFSWIGMGHFPDYDEADFNLYDELACTSHQIKPPQLPFDEVYNPAACFVFVRRPDLFKQLRKPDQPSWSHVHAVSAHVAGRHPELLKAA